MLTVYKKLSSCYHATRRKQFSKNKWLIVTDSLFKFLENAGIAEYSGLNGERWLWSFYFVKIKDLIKIQL